MIAKCSSYNNNIIIIINVSQQLEEETNIPEEQLFMLVREMLKGPEVEMLMSIM